MSDYFKLHNLSVGLGETEENKCTFIAVAENKYADVFLTTRLSLNSTEIINVVKK